MVKNLWLDLQLFAGEGAGGDGGGEGAASGENAPDAGEARLLELGVPAEKLRKRAKKSADPLPVGAVSATPPQKKQKTEQQAAAANPTEETTTNAPARMSWDEIMADPEYNKQMQTLIKNRISTIRVAEENLAKLAPALEVLARKHGLDVDNMDYDALAKAVNEDDDYYEDKALEMGVSVETAKKLDQQERESARQQKEQERTIEQQKVMQHIQRLEQQGEELKKTFPSFDLRKELQNPAFARMTAPNVGISVEDAYYAVHRNEIQAAAMQVTAQKTAQKISNAIQAGTRRPDENGTSGQAASVTTFNYRNASIEQRNALKKRIREAAARGEKLYPGM